MSTLLKHSLLLTHGTIYGQISLLSVVQCEGLTPNVTQWDDPDYDWREGLFEARTLNASTTGVMTDNSPIDFVHWSLTGSVSLSPMTPWRNCMKLLRHI